ncbi:MAG: octaprenyl diphosphate synthase [Gammaproteobacteria bacterium TMED78]|nr:MAG: octaprenyl diphosphate synthase [Gammaproteobacteria bacterium TMED78]|tara:strand:+ start:799 stop:1797 length:999 start_codon:yes stop_codon:yes gene_type:complete
MNRIDNKLELNFPQKLRELVAKDWESVNSLIARKLGSDVSLINQIAHHIIHGEGKRLRPLITLLASKACNYNGDKHINNAVIIEFIHTATLLHDDVVDNSGLRRGEKTANKVFGNQASILVGDFLYSRSFQMMMEIRELRVLDVLANTTNTIAEGEVLQLMHCKNPNTTEENYLEVIYRKTAKLFEAASRIGAIISKSDEQVENSLIKYGRHLGSAFQLIDDALDYNADHNDLGKNIGDDLSEGKPTLPLIYALQNGSAAERNMIKEAIQSGGTQNLKSIQLAIESSGGIRYTEEKAKEQIELAINSLNTLPENKYKKALIELANHSLSRNY